MAFSFGKKFKKDVEKSLFGVDDRFQGQLKDALRYLEMFLELEFAEEEAEETGEGIAFHLNFGQRLSAMNILQAPWEAEEDEPDGEETGGRVQPLSLTELCVGVEAFFHKLGRLVNGRVKKFNQEMWNFCWTDALRSVNAARDDAETQEEKRRILEARRRDFQFNSPDPEYNPGGAFRTALFWTQKRDYLQWLDFDEDARTIPNTPENRELREREWESGYVRRDALGLKLDAYKDCTGMPFCFYDHLTAYVLRNAAAHPAGDSNPLLAMEKEQDGKAYRVAIYRILSVFFCQCLKHREKIEEAYSLLYQGNMRYEAFAQGLMDLEAFDRAYLKLDWQRKGTEDKEALWVDFADPRESRPAYKLIGEAGAGKTTTMKKLYRDILGRVLGEEKLRLLPLWFDLKEWSAEEESGGLLERRIRDALGSERAEIYEKGSLLEDGQICLFLDGWNEVYLENALAKKKLAREIDEFHRAYPNIFLAMTDRLERPDILCLDRNVTVFEFHGMEYPAECLEYARKACAGPEDAAGACAYLEDREQSGWLEDRRLEITPEMMNHLIELICGENPARPESETEYYGMYMDHILYREHTDKRDERIEDFKDLLRKLAQYVYQKSLRQEDGSWEGEEPPIYWLSPGDIRDIWYRERGIAQEDAGKYLLLLKGMPFIEKHPAAEAYGFARIAYVLNAMKY